MAEDKNQEDAENFGLPDIEYKPLEQLDSSKTTEESTTAQEQTSSSKSTTQSSSTSEPAPYYEEEEESSKSGFVIALLVGLVLLVGGFLAYKYVWVPKQEKAKLALLEEKRKARDKVVADSLARVAEDERLKREAAANAKPADGTIETLADRTGRYYVVVSSSVDGDLAMDRAKKLSAEGKSTKIIPPFGKWKFYRLCIGDFDSFASAQSNADASKPEYGDALWVLKY
ncbi:MAG: SPOR domain-containing protein [Bacteroidetes bacterium]|nr:SPOR domain-containing protein [Bacteroidota bacterium]